MRYATTIRFHTYGFKRPQGLARFFAWRGLRSDKCYIIFCWTLNIKTRIGGLRVVGLGSRGWRWGFGGKGIEFRVWGLGFEVWSLRLGV